MAHATDIRPRVLSPGCEVAALGERYANCHQECRGNWARRLPEQPPFEPPVASGRCGCACHAGSAR